MNGNNYDHDKSAVFCNQICNKFNEKKESFPEPVIFTSKKIRRHELFDVIEIKIVFIVANTVNSYCKIVYNISNKKK